MRRNLLKLFPVLFFAPFLPAPVARNKPPTLQSGKVVGLFDEQGTCRIPVAFSFSEGTLPCLTCSPTGGYFTVSKFEGGALSHIEGYVSAIGEPHTPCAFNWVAVA